MSLRLMVKIVNTALEAKDIKLVLEVKAWPGGLHHSFSCQQILPPAHRLL